MALDLSNLLRKPAGSATKPQALPPGDYSGLIKSFEYGDQNKNKTPYVRFQVGLRDWPSNLSEDEKGTVNSEGNFVATDLSKRGLRKDFYLTDDAMWRLDDFLKSCGLAAGGSYEELIPKAIGENVTVEVQQYVNQQTSEVGNQVGKMVGAAG